MYNSQPGVGIRL